MARRFRVAGGKVAVWDGHTDLLPFNAPLTYLNRVKFHSDIPYVRIVDVRTFTVNIPATTTTMADRSVSYTLGAHGKAGQPFVIGRIVVGGVPVTFTGSVPVHQGGGVINDPYARWLALGADATNIYIHEYTVHSGPTTTGVYNVRPAQSFSIRCYITDILL